jgi:peptidoglycan-N-acetylglucosamine deacetylase
LALQAISLIARHEQPPPPENNAPTGASKLEHSAQSGTHSSFPSFLRSYFLSSSTLPQKILFQRWLSLSIAAIATNVLLDRSTVYLQITCHLAYFLPHHRRSHYRRTSSVILAFRLQRRFAQRGKIIPMNPWFVAIPSFAAGFVGLAAYGAAHPRSQLFGRTVFQTSQPRKLAITFDDGPNPAITPKLLDLLNRHKAKATFFLVGKYVRQAPDLTKEIASRGHLIGNHTDTHPNLFYCGPGETRAELLRCSEAIGQATWEEPRWFRPPFGFRSPWLGALVQQQRMRTVMWTLLPGDWRPKPTDWLIDRMKPIAEHVQALPAKNQPQPTGGDILCLHDGDYAHSNADREHTLASLEYWLPRWRDLGLEFVTMGEMNGKAVEA